MKFFYYFSVLKFETNKIQISLKELVSLKKKDFYIDQRIPIDLI